MVVKVVVITVEGPMSAYAPPLLRSRLEELAAGGAAMTPAEEVDVAKWALGISVIGLECPLDNARLHEVASAKKRSLSSEDAALCKWVRDVCDAVEGVMRR